MDGVQRAQGKELGLSFILFKRTLITFIIIMYNKSKTPFQCSVVMKAWSKDGMIKHLHNWSSSPTPQRRGNITKNHDQSVSPLDKQIFSRMPRLYCVVRDYVENCSIFCSTFYKMKMLRTVSPCVRAHANGSLVLRNRADQLESTAPGCVLFYLVQVV